MLTVLLTLAAALFAATPAEAHSFGVVGVGFEAGFAHPFSGLDHLLAMIGLGAWASLAGARLRWAMPSAFIAFMCFGALLGAAGGSLPAIETGIAGSVLVVGALIAIAPQSVPAWAAVGIAALGILHGHAHGSEIPAAASPIAYAAGFVIATGALHLAGIFGGDLLQRAGRLPRKAAGAGVTLAGLFLLVV